MDWLPGATRRLLHESGFSWQVDCPTKGILHTTEGPNPPDYPPQYEPHLTVVPIPRKGVRAEQHIAFSRAAYALKHPQGMVPTNGAHALQMELVGTCDPDPRSDARRAGSYYWAEADDAVLLDLWRKVIAPMSEAYGIHTTSLKYEAYPASAGTSNGVRLSGQDWLRYGGWAGHQHVPGNAHGDPGAFPFARMVHLGLTAKPSRKPWVVGGVVITGAGVILAGGIAHHGPPPPPKPRPVPSPTVTVTPVRPGPPPPTHVPAKLPRRVAPAPTIHGPLVVGSTGESVRVLQRKLGITADGIFGRRTARAVHAVQVRAHLAPDDVVGPKTAHALGLTYR